MKKFSLLSLCLSAGLAMSAQTALVDEVKHMLGESKPNYEEAMKKIQPALADPSTMNTAMPWYLAGKAAFGVYDTYYIQQSIGNTLSNEQKNTAANALLQGYNNYFVAIPLDIEINKKTGEPVMDKNGAPKPGKQVKEMQKTLKNNYSQLLQAGLMLWDAQNYEGAYDVWQVYVELPTNKMLGSEIPTADPDTVVGQIMYYQLLAALQSNQDEKALAKVAEIEKTGYQNIDVYVYGIEAARRLDNSAEMLKLAQKGYEKYGTENIQFVGQLINDKLTTNDFAACQQLLQEAIDATPAEQKDIRSQLLNILGIVYEQQDNYDKAIETFNQAIDTDPEVGKNYYDEARIYYNQAIRLDEASDNEYNVSNDVKDKLLKAAELFEKAYGLDSDNLTDVPNLLYKLYYRLGANYESKADYWNNLR